METTELHSVRKAVLMTMGLSFVVAGYATETPQNAPAEANQPAVTAIQKLNPTVVDILVEKDKRMTVDFYGDDIFRIFRDDKGGIVRDPEATPEAKILTSNPRRPVTRLDVEEKGDLLTITTGKIQIIVDKKSSLFKVVNLVTQQVVLEQVEPFRMERAKTEFALKQNADEYYYGGGVQNGRFSHKGKVIAIENQNSWTDGGVASPSPFYWSTKGYAMLWHTFKKGSYDFGSKEPGVVRLEHDTDYLDVFFMVGDGIVPLLNEYYQLTGHPVLLPKFAFYQGHLNAYNRDYWKEDEKGILFEDGKRYKESQKDNGGIKESLNGEKDNYQFSARAVIDRYKANDMPLGWLLPNDGYGAGYGQEDTLDGNIANLKSLADYAHQNGLEIGLWTQSDLHPKSDVSALLQRDIVKEVRDAGVRVLKTDVAWVGDGYSFGLNGITDVAQIMTYYGNNARPFIISLDGWAGTQRYASIWTGDQTGGDWEYIRFHVPTYIGSGLSGQPNICSDMDGIFGGKDLFVNTRDFQWKTFTLLELNMDGWGSNEKYPHALGEPATSINRWYLKMKSELLPYTYSIAAEAVTGLPMIRAMFLEGDATPYTLGKSTQYQFMFGPNFLVAPIYQQTKADENGNDIRNGIYLPEGQWIDFFTGDLYEGGKIFNYIDAPLWKLPVFVKNGSITPMANPNNNLSEARKDLRIFDVYPAGKTQFTLYDDDGTTEDYLLGHSATTEIVSDVQGQKAVITVQPTKGSYDGMVAQKSTEFRVNVTQKPSAVSVNTGSSAVSLKEVDSQEAFDSQENVYYYAAQPQLNRFASKDSEFSKVSIIGNPKLFVKVASVDTRTTPVELTVDGFVFRPENKLLKKSGAMNTPANATVTDEHTGPYTLTPSWDAVENADYYEIKFEDMVYTTIQEPELLFEGLTPETPYSFDVRAVNRDGATEWVNIKASTKSNPLEFAIPGIVGETTAENQSNSLSHLFDFTEKAMWHTRNNKKAVPFDLVMSLPSVNTLDKFEYIPREDAGNGTLLKGKVAVSMDRKEWKTIGSFEWNKDSETKTFTFKETPTARYIKLSVTEAVGDYGSGREIYVFKVPGTESYIPGDINNDGKLDSNDLTSYTNYTGLRKGDSDFEGYISGGDINKNGLIDAYDISEVATRIEGGVEPDEKEAVGGKLVLSPSKTNFKKDDVIEVVVKGKDLKFVNALSFALPYDASLFEYVGVEMTGMKDMENMTYDRLHTNGKKALYPTFVNVGNHEVLTGSEKLFTIKLKALKDGKYSLKAQDGLLVDRKLNTKGI